MTYRTRITVFHGAHDADGFLKTLDPRDVLRVFTYGPSHLSLGVVYRERAPVEGVPVVEDTDAEAVLDD